MNTRTVFSHARRCGATSSPVRWSVTALTAVLILGGAAFEAAGQSRPLLIVSAGESYASGEGAPDSIDPTQWLGDNTIDGVASECHRSGRASAADTANRLRAAWPVEFASVACSGAVTGTGVATWLSDGNRTAHQSMLGEGGQLSKIRQHFAGRRIDALVMSIGGNDLGFDKIVMTCMAPESIFQPGCYLGLDVPLAQEMAALPGRLRQLTDAVNQLGLAGVDVRHVFLVQYPDPTTGIFGLRCGGPHVPLTDGGMDGIRDDEATWASTRVVAPLNAALAAAVGEANKGAGPIGGPQWHLVTGLVEAFQGHGYCAFDGDRFINTLFDSLGTQGDWNGTMHPNVYGQAAIANVLTQAMGPLAVPQAVFVAQSVPAFMAPGRTYPVSVTMRNTGSVTWTPQDGIRLGSQGPQDNMTWGVGRVALPGSVEPGQQVTFIFNVTAPAQPGAYTFQWRMVQEMVQWFGAFTPATSVPVRQMTVEVVQNSLSLTAANITVYARDAVTGALLSGTVTLDGVVVGQLGQPFTYARVSTRVCEIVGRRPVCYTEFETREFQVNVPGYLPVSFWRE